MSIVNIYDIYNIYIISIWEAEKEAISTFFIRVYII